MNAIAQTVNTLYVSLISLVNISLSSKLILLLLLSNNKNSDFKYAFCAQDAKTSDKNMAQNLWNNVLSLPLQAREHWKLPLLETKIARINRTRYPQAKKLDTKWTSIITLERTLPIQMKFYSVIACARVRTRYKLLDNSADLPGNVFHGRGNTRSSCEIDYDPHYEFPPYENPPYENTTNDSLPIPSPHYMKYSSQALRIPPLPTTNLTNSIAPHPNSYVQKKMTEDMQLDPLAENQDKAEQIAKKQKQAEVRKGEETVEFPQDLENQTTSTVTQKLTPVNTHKQTKKYYGIYFAQGYATPAQVEAALKKKFKSDTEEFYKIVDLRLGITINNNLDIEHNYSVSKSQHPHLPPHKL
jgi:hypothetical protein